MRLNCTELDARTLPSASTLADILPHYDADYIRPMPDVPAANILVGVVDLDPLDSANDLVDIFVAHGDGYAARVAIKAEGTSGAIAADFFAFHPDFRGGGESFTVIGTELFVTPGAGGGPVVAAIDLLTYEVRTFYVSGFSESWRGGLTLTAFDTDYGNVLSTVEYVSPDPEQELIVLAATPGAGPVVSIVNPDGTSARPPFLFFPPEERGEWDFVPAGVGVQFSPGVMGMLLENANDPETTVAVTWDGVVV